MSQNSALQRTDTASENAYDLVQYDSHSYPDTHPAKMATVAYIFGLKPPALETARVLELGCASGGNIMSLALDFPQAEFVGIDLSAAQIAAGQETIKGLGLTNIALHQMDIAQAAKNLGKFDYIMCHGVFSWVTDEVRAAILDLCRTNLNPDGLAAITYNVMPGWAVVRSIRDMMLYHVNRFQNPHDKIKQSRQLIEFLHANTPEGSPYKKAIENERAILRSAGDYYIAHEYLEEENHPFFFHEFAAMLGDHNLGYVGDSQLATMFAGNLPADAFEKLKAVNDQVPQEQYMDFINNRRFRHSIITHQDRMKEINRNIPAERIFDFHIATDLVEIGEEEANATSRENLKKGQNVFKSPSTGRQMSVADKFLTPLLREMSGQSGRPLDLKLLIAKVAEKEGLDADLLRKSVLSNGPMLVFSGVWQPTFDRPLYADNIAQMPKAYPLARYQAAQPGCSWVTSARRQTCKVDATAALMLRCFDGKTTVEDAAARLNKMMADKGLVMNLDGKPVTDPQTRTETLIRLIREYLPRFLASGLLVD